MIALRTVRDCSVSKHAKYTKFSKSGKTQKTLGLLYNAGNFYE